MPPSRIAHKLVTAAALLLGTAALWAAPASPANDLLSTWRKAYATSPATALRDLFGPGGGMVGTPAGDIPASQDAEFWATQRQSGHTAASFEDTHTSTQGNQMQVVTRIVLAGAAPKVRPAYVNIGMLWESAGGKWVLKYARRTDASRLRQPLDTSKDIYAAGHDARTDIQNALQRASLQGKNLLIVFGANWCYDCHVLDLAFERGEVAELVRHNFEVVHVDIGQGDRNQDLMRQYGVPVERGIPAVAVLDGKGTLLTSQRSGEFAPARRLGPEDLEAFLNKWKPHHS